METIPDDVTIIDDGGDICAVFASNQRAREIVQSMVPSAQFEADRSGMLPADCEVAAIKLCSDCIEGTQV